MGCAPSAAGGDKIYRPQQAPREPPPSSPSVKVQQPKSPESPRKSVSELHFSPLTPTLLGEGGIHRTRKLSTDDNTSYKKKQSASLIDTEINVSVPGHADEKTGENSIKSISNTFLTGRRWVKKKREEELPVDIKPGLPTGQSDEDAEATVMSVTGLSYGSDPRRTRQKSTQEEENEEEAKKEESSGPHKYELDDTDAPTILPAGQDGSSRTTKVGKPFLRGFEIGVLLGKGAFGKTFQAVRKSDGKVLALKLARCANMDMANHIMAEVLNMIALPKHSNIVRYESCFITDATERKLVDLGGGGGVEEDSSDIAIGIVMELCAGGDLKQSISTRRQHDPILPYTEDALLDIIIPCLQALAHIHSYKVIHRDIKPHNLLLDAGGNVKLADFGEANMGEATELAGTYAYMAPEVIAREAYGVGCDIWSLGCVMLDLMTLTFSFERKLNHARLDLYKFTQEQIHELIQESTDGKYSENVKELLSSMLEKDPRKRSTAEECLRKPFVTSWLDSQRFNDDEDRDIFADMNMIASRASHKGCAPMYLAAASGLSQVCRYYFSYGVPLTQPRTNSTYTTPLFAAIEQGHVKTVSTLLELGADPYQEIDGCHSMIWAAKNGQEAIVRTLVEKGVPVNHRASTTNKPTSQHVLDDLNFDMIRVLLELGVDSTSTDSSGHSVAHVAMIHERKDVIQFLIDRNAPLKEKSTYIHLAALLGKPTIIELLLNSTKFSVDDLDPKRLTPLHAAVSHKHVEAVQKLIQHGANVNYLSASKTSPLFIASYVGSEEIVRLLLDHGADSTVTRDDGSTPLAAACQEGHLEVAKLLLSHGASADTFDKYHRSPLQMALENGHMEIVSLLIDSASDSQITGVPNHKHLDLSEVIHAMILQGSLERLNQLTGFGADLNQPYMGVAPLQQAVESGNMDICRFLLDKNVDVNVRDLTGRTPLMLAIEKANPELIRLLIDHGADVNVTDNRLNTALLLAVSLNQLELVSDLLDHKAVVDAPNERGLRPLHAASCNGYLDVVEKLLSCGADPMLKRDDGADSLSLAEQAGHLEVMNRLLSHMGRPPVEAVTDPTAQVIRADMANPVEGAVLDALDCQRTWYEGMIAAVQPTKVLIRFWHRGNCRFWSSNNDEWIDRNDPSRLAPLGTHVETDPRFLQSLVRDQSLVLASMVRPARVHYRWTAGRKVEVGALCALVNSAEDEEKPLRVCLVMEGSVYHGSQTTAIWARVRLWDDLKNDWMDYTHNITVPSTDLREIDESSITPELTRLANLHLDQHLETTARLERKSTRKYNLVETVAGENDVGSTVDAQDYVGHWYPAVIVSRNETTVLVQFWNHRVEKWWAANFNESIPIDSSRMAPLHTHTTPSSTFAQAALSFI